MISVLYAQENGCYDGHDLFIDVWTEKRNALNYTGKNPVIAHPPCQRWGKMAKVNHARWGGDHNKLGNDGGTFHSALENVNRCGGVLEHPAQTYAWAEYGLNKPEKNKWIKSGKGWVCEVWQSAYGHRANKATWLYFVGKAKPFNLNWERKKGDFQIGFQDQRGKARNKPTLNKKEANATPEAFKMLMIKLADFSRQGI